MLKEMGMGFHSAATTVSPVYKPHCVPLADAPLAIANHIARCRADASGTRGMNNQRYESLGRLLVTTDS